MLFSYHIYDISMKLARLKKPGAVYHTVGSNLFINSDHVCLYKTYLYKIFYYLVT